jgi:FkbM family methyltransferase
VREDTIYDVGLHKGEDTAYYLNKGYKVVAIEANPELIAACKTRFAKFIEQGRLTIVEGAIASAESGDTVTFYKNANMSIWGTIDPDWAQRNAVKGHRSEVITVSRIAIDSVYERFGVPLYLKIDVEGADTLVLEGLRGLKDKPQFVSIESEKVDFDKLKEEFSLLGSLGYKKFKVVQQRSIPRSVFKTETRDGQPLAHTFEEGASGPFGDDLASTWMTAEEALAAYKKIFFQYKYFGDNSFYIGMPRVLKGVVSVLYRIATGHRGPLPGWYDTHASL